MIPNNLRGEYGSCVLDSYTVLTARPGLRLWYASSNGQVLKTLQLKKVLNECALHCSSPGVDQVWFSRQ